MSGSGKVVSVTGASGYIASCLVKLLLQHGYTVKASVRDLSKLSLPNTCDPKKTEHLLSLDGAKERLHLFKANLLEEGSFDSLVDGSDGVFHTASPVNFTVNDPQAELIEPALKGTLNVLRSCAKSASCKRVILTSSMATVAFNGTPLTPDVVVDETWFSDPTFCEKSKFLCFHKSSCYEDVDVFPFAFVHAHLMLSNNEHLHSQTGTGRLENGFLYSSIYFATLTTNYNKQDGSVYDILFSLFVLVNHCSAHVKESSCWKEEKNKKVKHLSTAALSFTDKFDLHDFSCYSFGFVIGPLLQPTLNLSVEFLLNHINEANISNVFYRYVDVRDVALAHVQAFEVPSASGRYCLVGHVVHILEALNIIRQLYPNLSLPDKCKDEEPLLRMQGYQVSKEKAKSLGVNYTPLEVTLKDTVESLKEKGFLKL
ncbi:hypothetical protein F8388_002612 [Cannabis sativa]|uniref:NAD-dependent epimerase/dehydratase domain-containing protein n=1 Tax=Cannabis sativa TaxID=3483 RepID=A0A7J6FBC7_CANSA|nr:hypothetical protein F8388_002612 [Cannabis sativa]